MKSLVLKLVSITTIIVTDSTIQCGEKGHYANTCPKSFRAMQMALATTQPNVGVK